MQIGAPKPRDLAERPEAPALEDARSAEIGRLSVGQRAEARELADSAALPTDPEHAADCRPASAGHPPRWRLPPTRLARDLARDAMSHERAEPAVSGASATRTTMPMLGRDAATSRAISAGGPITRASPRASNAMPRIPVRTSTRGEHARATRRARRARAHRDTTGIRKITSEATTKLDKKIGLVRVIG